MLNAIFERQLRGALERMGITADEAQIRDLAHIAQFTALLSPAALDGLDLTPGQTQAVLLAAGYTTAANQTPLPMVRPDQSARLITIVTAFTAGARPATWAVHVTEDLSGTVAQVTAVQEVRR